MVSYSDNIRDFLKSLDEADHLGNAGNIYYLQFLADENDTYSAGEGINLLATCGGITAVLNCMSLETKQPSLEIWVFGEDAGAAEEILNDCACRYAGAECHIHTNNTKLTEQFKARGAKLYDQVAEYLGVGLDFDLSGDIHKLSLDEMSIISNLVDEQTAMYCGSLPLDNDNCTVYGRLMAGSPITICTIEKNDYGYGSIVEPVWVYTAKTRRRRGWAFRCISHALYGTTENCIILYHTDVDNRASMALAESLGLKLNNICYTLAVKL
ncbi:MAG: hypothetical protein IKC38_00775 [Clostridia bacterium]|nr:hypothetical protein [Clostridia bacterium]